MVLVAGDKITQLIKWTTQYALNFQSPSRITTQPDALTNIFLLKHRPPQSFPCQGAGGVKRQQHPRVSEKRGSRRKQVAVLGVREGDDEGVHDGEDGSPRRPVAPFCSGTS